MHAKYRKMRIFILKDRRAAWRHWYTQHILESYYLEGRVAMLVSIIPCKVLLCTSLRHMQLGPLIVSQLLKGGFLISGVVIVEPLIKEPPRKG